MSTAPATKAERPVWTKGTVDVALRPVFDADRPVLKRTGVPADVWGVFAVHETIISWEFGWTVTHTPTGYSLLASARTRTAAKQFCAEVADLLDWSKLKPTNSRRMVAPVKEQLLEATRKARP